MKWTDTPWLINQCFNIQPIRYVILLVTILIIGNLFNPIQPWVSSALNYSIIRWLVLFLAVLLSIYDINKTLTYKSITIAFSVSIIITIILYLFLHDIYSEILSSKIKENELIQLRQLLQNPTIQEFIRQQEEKEQAEKEQAEKKTSRNRK